MIERATPNPLAPPLSPPCPDCGYAPQLRTPGFVYCDDGRVLCPGCRPRAEIPHRWRLKGAVAA